MQVTTTDSSTSRANAQCTGSSVELLLLCYFKMVRPVILGEVWGWLALAAAAPTAFVAAAPSTL
jgi:hypothetical protein